jgi:radical SAM-linked protein
MRLRITFSKTGALRYTGHLDLHRIWERTARRAGLPLAYSQGFHPQPKIQIAAALPLGFSGRAEIVDLWMTESADLEAQSDRIQDIAPSLQRAAPPGLGILGVEAVEASAPPLQTQVAAAEYEVILLEAGPGSDLGRRVEDLLAKTTLPRERRGRQYDLRPLILELECGEAALRMVLSAREGATGRPEEVLDALGIPFETTRIERIRLILKNEIE